MTTKRAVKSLKMIGMNVAVVNLGVGIRVLTPRSLILGSFGTVLMGLVALILDADSDPFRQDRRRATAFTSVKSFTTNGKKKIAVATFPICEKREFVGLRNDLIEGLHCLHHQHG